MTELHWRLKPIRLRQRWTSAVRAAAWGLLAGGIAGLALGTARHFGLAVALWQIIGALLSFPICGFLFGLVWPRDWNTAARAVDRHYGLKDRTITALQFLSRSQEQDIHRLQVQDALAHLGAVKPREVVPIRVPRILTLAVLLVGMTGVLMFLTRGPEASANTLEVLPVVAQQAIAVDDHLDDLKEFEEENPDPELEKLIQEIDEKLDELREPGVDIREALAKLSEMETALQNKMAEYNVAAVDAQFAALGEALSLAEPLESAGKSLMEGEFDRAAEELEKLDTPELDRQTERTLKDELKKAAASMQNGGMSSLGEATKSMSEGLGADSVRFLEGAKKLAGECKSHSKRKKLHDLLLKQCQCLGECKSECEGSCKSAGQSSKKGGNQWGLGASGNAPGEPTANLGTRQQEKLTGQQSEDGELEVETIHAPEGEQNAQRSYQEVYREYRKMSEAVLENEPIPLGHRQTIRRYFESIRPQQGELPAEE